MSGRGHEAAFLAARIVEWSSTERRTGPHAWAALVDCLEAALYGHELDDATSPLEARLDRFVKREAGGFLGAEAIERRAAAGHTKLLVGLELRGRGIPREGYPIAHEGAEVGRVTSGAPSPTLGKSIGLGYVRPAFGEKGTLLDVMIRGRGVAARVVETPFVRAGHPEPPT